VRASGPNYTLPERSCHPERNLRVRRSRVSSAEALNAPKGKDLCEAMAFLRSRATRKSLRPHARSALRGNSDSSLHSE
jgi:hypothetical protein